MSTVDRVRTAVLWFVHEEIAHPVMNAMTQAGWVMIRAGRSVQVQARRLHDATVPDIGIRPAPRKAVR